MNKMNYYFSNSSILTRYSVCSIRLSLTIYNNLIISIVAFVVVTIFENYITRYIFYEYFNTQLYIMTSIHIWIYVPLHFLLLTKFILQTLNLFHGSLVLILNRQFGLLCGGRRMEDEWFSNLLNGDQGLP